MLQLKHLQTLVIFPLHSFILCITCIPITWTVGIAMTEQNHKPHSQAPPPACADETFFTAHTGGTLGMRLQNHILEIKLRVYKLVSFGSKIVAKASWNNNCARHPWFHSWDSLQLSIPSSPDMMHPCTVKNMPTPIFATRCYTGLFITQKYAHPITSTKETTGIALVGLERKGLLQYYFLWISLSLYAIA